MDNSNPPNPTLTPPVEETTIEKPGLISGVDRNNLVDERLKEFGIEVEEEKKPEEKPVEPLKEEVKEEIKEEIKVPGTPVEEKKEEEDKVSDADAQKIIEKQTGEKKSEDEVYPWEKEKRIPTDKEIIDYTAEKSAQIVERRQKEKQAEVDAVKVEEDKKVDAWKTHWAKQYDELEKDGIIRPIKDVNDTSDPGVTDRNEIWNAMVKSGRTSVIETYYREVSPNKGKQPKGATAPIVGSESGASPENTDEEYSYDEIHGKSFDDIRDEAK